MRRQRHKKERGGSRRHFVLHCAPEQRLEFSSKTALLHWARQEARRQLPMAVAPWVHLTSRGQLLAHASRAAYEQWLTRPRSHRHVQRTGHSDHILLGSVRKHARGDGPAGES